MSGPAATTNANGTSAHAPPPPHPTMADDPRQPQHVHRARKTSIQGDSGVWNLSKTIGAGSMGKVKLARKADGSEQVTSSASLSLPPPKHPCLPLCHRLPSKLFRDKS